LVPPSVGRPSAWRRLQGYEDIDVFGRAPVDVALARLRTSVPVQAAPRRPGAFDVLADWDERRSRSSQAFPLRLEGDLIATGLESFRFTAVRGPATAGRRGCSPGCRRRIVDELAPEGSMGPYGVPMVPPPPRRPPW
jgi:hypothetical protein